MSMLNYLWSYLDITTFLTKYGVDLTTMTTYEQTMVVSVTNIFLLLFMVFIIVMLYHMIKLTMSFYKLFL